MAEDDAEPLTGTTSPASLSAERPLLPSSGRRLQLPLWSNSLGVPKTITYTQTEKKKHFPFSLWRLWMCAAQPDVSNTCTWCDASCRSKQSLWIITEVFDRSCLLLHFCILHLMLVGQKKRQDFNPTTRRCLVPDRESTGSAPPWPPWPLRPPFTGCYPVWLRNISIVSMQKLLPHPWLSKWLCSVPLYNV